MPTSTAQMYMAHEPTNLVPLFADEDGHAWDWRPIVVEAAARVQAPHSGETRMPHAGDAERGFFTSCEYCWCKGSTCTQV